MTDSVTVSLTGNTFFGIRGVYAIWARTAGYTPSLPADWFSDTTLSGTQRRLTQVRIEATGTLRIDIGGASDRDLKEEVRSALSATLTVSGSSVTADAPLGGTDDDDPYIWIPDNSADWVAFYEALVSQTRAAGTITLALQASALQGELLGTAVGFARPRIVPRLVPAALPISAALEGRITPALVAEPLAGAVAFRRPTLGNARRGLVLPIGVSLPDAALSPPPSLEGRALALDVALAGRLAPEPIVGLPLPLAVGLPRPFPPRLEGETLPIALSLRAARLRTSAERFAQARRETAPEDDILTALEITHPAISTPVRVVNDAEDRVIEGETYTAVRFDAVLASHQEGEAPRAQLQIDNVGRELNTWVEATGGGIGAQVRAMQLLAGQSSPDWEVVMEVLTVNVSSERVTATLGFDALLGRPAVRLRFDPEHAPGLF